MIRRRWWLLVKDVKGRVIFVQTFRTKGGATRHGREIASPPVNRFEVRRGPTAGGEGNGR